ncbi:hypothetical protein ACPCC3_33405 [Streptomyces cellulosae]|uniref:Uncharacterized protein n=1 Tax=Streptomyces thermodiastaticus TaxID=44061 RepID=A0ABU0KTQ3_9ACTN|nr:hypothetical protein [Streptomyces sp. McG7]MDQ0491352.1 hypothetical protein [Streptomyces thermodiastaticus]
MTRAQLTGTDLPDRNSSAYFGWGSAGEELCRALEEQALRFHDKAVHDFLQRVHAERYVRPEFVAGPETWPPSYVIITLDIQTGVGTVLRRQPFPKSGSTIPTRHDAVRGARIERCSASWPPRT